MINKKKFTLKGSIILIILILVSTTLTFSKLKVNVDGTININIGKKSGNTSTGIWDNDDKYTNVGDITDRQYNMQPFIINDKGYAVIKDSTRFYILQVTFYNGDISSVKK